MTRRGLFKTGNVLLWFIHFMDSIIYNLDESNEEAYAMITLSETVQNEKGGIDVRVFTHDRTR